jgi:hypothetical protein
MVDCAFFSFKCHCHSVFCHLMSCGPLPCATLPCCLSSLSHLCLHPLLCTSSSPPAALTILAEACLVMASTVEVTPTGCWHKCSAMSQSLCSAVTKPQFLFTVNRNLLLIVLEVRAEGSCGEGGCSFITV